MLRMWDVWNAKCLGYRMFAMCDIQDVVYLAWEKFGMWDVLNVG